MKPYIISHMMASVDGRIDCAMTEQIDSGNAYYEALDKLGCDSQLMGRVTMQMHYADGEPLQAAGSAPLGRRDFHVAARAEGYTVATDTFGKLRWAHSEYDGRPLLVITGEACPKEYVDMLTGQNISWIAAGSAGTDLREAMDILYGEFGVRRLAVTGGGHINGAFLRAGLIDEVSVMIGPGIDGRKGMTSLFDGIDDMGKPATLLRLESVEQTGGGTVWLRYAVRGGDGAHGLQRL